MSTIKILSLALILILFCDVSFAEYKSFVDETVYDMWLFEEDPVDAFVNEKREINGLVLKYYSTIEKDPKSAEIYTKIIRRKCDELNMKANKKYGLFGGYTYRVMSFGNRTLEQRLEKFFPYYNVSNYSRKELEEKLSDKKTWEDFNNNMGIKTMGGVWIPDFERRFRVYKKNFNLCKDILGENNPITLKHKLTLIEDYSLLGDSKTALKMEKDILPKIKKTFGEKSTEHSQILKLMANDCKVLGNYAKSEELLLKVIDMDKSLYGEENSPELLLDIIELISLKKSTPPNDPILYDELEKAAKGISKEDLYRFGYFRIKYLNDTSLYTKENLKLFREICTKEDFARSEGYGLITGKWNYGSSLHNWQGRFRFSEKLKQLGVYQAALNNDISLWLSSVRQLRKHHYKTLKTLCNLSEDFLILNQIEDALSISQEALQTSQKFYGDEHPCTIYTMHSLTNVYRKMGLYSEALELDQKAYKICQKIFVESSAGEPLEKLIVMEGIAADYAGLKNYDEAIKYSEELLKKYEANNAIDFLYHAAELRKNLAHLYNLTGNYEKTVSLYNFLKNDGGEYSFEKLFPKGLIACESAFILGDALEHIGQYKAMVDLYLNALRTYENLRSINEGLPNEDKSRWFENFIPNYKKAASFFKTKNLSFMTIELCKARSLAEQYCELLATSNGGLSAEDYFKLVEEQRKSLHYKEDFGNEFKNGGNTLKFDLRMAQFHAISNYMTVQGWLKEKYPKYKEVLNGVSILNENLFNEEIIKQIVPQNSCYITFLIVKKDIAPNRLSDEILACVVNDDGSINKFKIEVDTNFFDKCNLYHDLLAYSTERNKYLWKLPEENYIFTETRGFSVKNAVHIKKDSQELKELIKNLSAEIGEKLLTTLNDSISSKKTLIISSDGELNSIPFETLQFNGKMAIESADICYVPSFAVLKLMQDMKAKNDSIQNRKELFAMGNAIYGKDNYSHSRGSLKEFLQDLKENPNSYVDLTKIKWNNLKYSSDELKSVSEIFSDDSQEILTDVNASEKNLKRRNKDGQLSKYKYLLFSTHGMFVSEKSELTSIVLSQGLNDENCDGYITVGELFGYNLNSDLIYLSACESGLGDYQAGEGIIGLPYALTVAGNKDTVMTLWKVYDSITPEFTSKFFQKIKDGKTEVQALNETKREFLSSPNSQLNNPTVWSAFVLYGI